MAMIMTASVRPSEIPFRTNYLDAVSRLVRYDLSRWMRAPHKKPLLRQMRELADLWRRYRFAPYQYIKNELYRSEIGDDYAGYIPTVVAERYVYEVNNAEAIDCLEDKLQYEARMEACGLSHMRRLATLRRGDDGVTIEARDGRRLSFDEFFALAKGEGQHGLFVKPRLGLAGIGAFRLQVGADRFERHGKAFSEADLLEQLRTSEYTEYLVQPYFRQHEELARVNPLSVNTLRAYTLRTGDKAEMIGAILRVGSGVTETDNWRFGGYVLSVDLHTGAVGNCAFVHDDFIKGRDPARHAVTGVEFATVKLPYMPAVVDLVTKGALALAPARLIGWDVAFGPEAPCAIEANAIPGFRALQHVSGGLRETCYGKEMAIRYGWT